MITSAPVPPLRSLAQGPGRPATALLLVTEALRPEGSLTVSVVAYEPGAPKRCAAVGPVALAPPAKLHA